MSAWQDWHAREPTYLAGSWGCGAVSPGVCAHKAPVADTATSMISKKYRMNRRVPGELQLPRLLNVQPIVKSLRRPPLVSSEAHPLIRVVTRPRVKKLAF